MIIECQPKGQAHLQFSQANTKTQNCKRACPANARKKKQRNGNNAYSLWRVKC